MSIDQPLTATTLAKGGGYKAVLLHLALSPSVTSGNSVSVGRRTLTHQEVGAGTGSAGSYRPEADI